MNNVNTKAIFFSSPKKTSLEVPDTAKCMYMIIFTILNYLIISRYIDNVNTYLHQINTFCFQGARAFVNFSVILMT